MSKLTVEQRLAKLDALELAGVEFWGKYDEAMESWKNYMAQEELVEKLVDELHEILVTNGVVEYPAGTEAGSSVYLTEAGEEALNTLVRAFTKNLVLV